MAIIAIIKNRGPTLLMKFLNKIAIILLLMTLSLSGFLSADEFTLTQNSIIQMQDKNLLICKELKSFKHSTLFLELNNPQETESFYNDFCKHSTSNAWSGSNFELTSGANDLIQSIQDSYNQGLNPQKYHLQALLLDAQDLNASDGQKYHTLNSIDILLTDAYISLAKDLYYGFTDWKQFKVSKREKNKKLNENKDLNISEKENTIEWDRPKKAPLNLVKYLAQNLMLQKISDSLQALTPNSQEYKRLEEALKHYRELSAQGGWKPIPCGPTIRIDQTDDRLPLIKARLLITGDLSNIENNATTLYNETTFIDAVKTFQIRHNLTPDSIIGKRTIEALNVSASTLVSKIILNLERLRWDRRDMDQCEAYIDINVPAFEMEVLEHGKEVMDMKVIVGKKERPTPILESKVSYAVLHPSWTAPKTIVKEDILEKNNMQEYLLNHNMRIFQNNDGNLVEVNYEDVNWSAFANKENVPYIFKADSGKSNPLGEVKFIFNNKYSIYMHDTNQRYLFKNQYRALSSGCLRLSEPMKLLTYLLEKDDTIIDQKKDSNASEDDTDEIVNIKKRIPVLIKYMTVNVDDKGIIHFYDDIYGYDSLLKDSIKDNSFKL